LPFIGGGAPNEAYIDIDIDIGIDRYRYIYTYIYIYIYIYPTDHWPLALPCPSQVEELQMKLEDIQKGSYKHFMLKEICEQPEVSTLWRDPPLCIVWVNPRRVDPSTCSGTRASFSY